MTTLADIRVLLVEDEPLVAMGIADQLSAAGAVIVGPCQTARRAIDVLQDTAVDVAVIDFVLADSNSKPVQDALESKGVPFVVLTAYPPVLVRRHEGQRFSQSQWQLTCSARRSRHFVVGTKADRPARHFRLARWSRVNFASSGS
jgi:DNA-binding response OmpR family regulator